MKEHNTNFYSLENIKETLESCKDFLDGEEVYYHIGALRYAYEEIERLNNIIDELEKKMDINFVIKNEDLSGDQIIDTKQTEGAILFRDYLKQELK